MLDYVIRASSDKDWVAMSNKTLNVSLAYLTGRVCNPDRSPFGVVSSAWSQALYCECLYDDELIEDNDLTKRIVMQRSETNRLSGRTLRFNDLLIAR